MGAFSDIGSSETMSDTDIAFINRLAKKIQSSGFVTPSVFFLEMLRPFSSLGSHGMVFLGPIVTGFVQSDGYYRAAELLNNKTTIYCGNKNIDVYRFEEKLSNGKKFHTVYLKDYTYQNSDVFTVPKDHYFFLGDNRDCSKDSRFLSSVGYVHKDNLVGKAQFIFFSSDKKIGNIFAFWKWHKSIRFNRTFDQIN